MKKIKILVITPYFYPKIGGVEKHTYNLYKGLKKKYNYEIVVITSNHESKKYKEEILEGMKIYRLASQFKVSNTPVNFKWKKQIKEIIKKENPNMIMAHSPVPFISDVTILSNKNLPVILKYHSGSMKKEKRSFTNILIYIYEKVLLPMVLNKSNYIICTSDFVKNNFLKGYNNKSITITPSVDVDKFKPLEKSKTNKNFNILYVGRIDKTSRWKGIQYLLGSIKFISKNNSNILLTIVGDGDAIEYYKSQVLKLKIEDYVEFKGSLSGNDLVKKYQETDVLVLPSTSEAESFGMVLIEAMACKKPVIGSKMGGIPYVIDDGENGLLVPPKNTQSLAGAIIKILENPKLAKQMGEKGYKKVKENFTLENQINETNKIILKVLKK